MVPSLEVDAEPWPTLGKQVCDFIQDYMVYGPGDLRGQPVVLAPEQKLWIYRMYEVHPAGSVDVTGRPNGGKRRFRRCVLSLAKGMAKTELAAFIACAELHPEGPVRCDGFDQWGRPVGRPVNDPYIPMVAYTEEQTEDLAYAALKAIIEEAGMDDVFDIGLERIMRKEGDGKALAMSSSPNARDGARTTFQHFDETHRFNLPRLREAHKTMQANLNKRPLAEPWGLETSTAFLPGENSIHEQATDLALQIEAGRSTNPNFFFFHCQASDEHDIETDEGLQAALVETSMSFAEWRDIAGIIADFRDPAADLAYMERMYLNRSKQTSLQAFPKKRWAELSRCTCGHIAGDHTGNVLYKQACGIAECACRQLVEGGYRPAKGALVTGGFDGSIWDDATALIGEEVSTGHQFVIGIWENPSTAGHKVENWKVPELDVDAAMTQFMSDYEVWRVYCDPYHWEGWVATWQGRWTDKVVVRWPTNRWTAMGYALKGYFNSMVQGFISHDGDRDFARHIGNAVRRLLNIKDSDGSPLWLIQKDKPDSPNKMDAAMAGCLADEARRDAIAAGAEPQNGPSAYETEDLVIV